MKTIDDKVNNHGRRILRLPPSPMFFKKVNNMLMIDLKKVLNIINMIENHSDYDIESLSDYNAISDPIQEPLDLINSIKIL